jgi:1,4-dihydroxy-2-naphthoate octaprenyltransferase
MYLFLMVMAYFGIFLMALSGTITMWVLVIFLSLPLAVKLLRQMVEAIPADADAQTAKLDTAFGLLLVISLVLKGLVG